MSLKKCPGCKFVETAEILFNNGEGKCKTECDRIDEFMRINGIATSNKLLEKMKNREQIINSSSPTTPFLEGNDGPDLK